MPITETTPLAVDGVPDDVASALTAMAREDSGRVLAVLARRFGDLDLADEAVQEALVAAATTWPARGIPDNPGGWLMTVARNNAIDRLRRAAAARRREQAALRDLATLDVGRRAEVPVPIDVGQDADQPNEDQLRLMLLCCHPALDRSAQIALTLRLVGGLTTAEIAAAFLVPEPTLAQRIVRAKRKIRDSAIPLRIPHDLDDRLDVVHGVLYLIFNEGYLSRSGSELAIREDLVNQSIRLTMRLLDVLPEHPETLGLSALQHFHRARVSTRLDGAGDLVLLEDQDRTQWDLAEIRTANALLARAMRQTSPGVYQVQAVIAGYHANARTAADTDWTAIAAAYRQLVAMTNSTVVQINHAVAVAMADGPLAGLALLDQLPAMDGYHLFHGARAELLLRAGRPAEAGAAFARARALTENPAEQRHLDRRQRSCSQGPGHSGATT